MTPVGGPGVTFKYLDSDDREFADTDTMLDGHQVDLGAVDTIIKVRVLSADGTATHTYTIQVSRAGIPDAPDISGVTAGAASLHVAWTAPSDTGGARSFPTTCATSRPTHLPSPTPTGP